MRHLWSKKNPFREPHWRWLRISSIVDGSGPGFNRRYDDTAIRNGLAFRRLLDQSHAAAADSVLAWNYPDHYWAHHVYREGNVPSMLGDDRRAHLRWEIEARILARQTDNEIADATGLDPEVLEVYTTLFFDVRPRMANIGYIVNQVIGPAVHRTLTMREYPTLWKLIGYLHGPHMLHAIMQGSIEPSWPDSGKSVRLAAQEAANNDLVRHALLALRTLKNDSYTQDAILGRYLEMQNTDKLAGAGAGDGGDSLKAGLHDLLENFKEVVIVGDPRLSSVDQPTMSIYHESSAELRFEEQMQLALGHEAPPPAALATIKFPERTQAQDVPAESEA